MKIFKKIIKNLFWRELSYWQKKPLIGTFFLTYRCTSRCSTCTMWKRHVDRDKELDLEDWKKIIDLTYNNGVKIVELFGGDVLLRKDLLLPLIHYIKTKGMIIHMPTNANLMDRDAAIQFADAGVDNIYISVDGIGDTQDDIRGLPGTFERVDKAVKLLLKARGKKTLPRLICNTTVSKYNIEFLERIAAYAEKTGFDENHFEYVGEMREEDIDQSIIEGIRPEPYYIQQGDSVLVSKLQAQSLKKRLKQIKKDYRHKKLQIRTINIDTLSIEDLYQGNVDNRKCYVERTEITIDPYGNVIACPFIGNYVLGNILKKDFHGIWNNERHLVFRNYQNSGAIALCRHCILGVQRNHPFLIAVKRNLILGPDWGKYFGF